MAFAPWAVPRRSGSLHPAYAALGFTLLEVMIAVSIVAIVLLAVYRVHSQTLLMNHAASFYTIAPLLAQEKLAELEMKPPEELADESGDFGDEYPGYAWEVIISTVESEVLDTEAENLKRIDLNLQFNNGERIYSVRTFRYMPSTR
jgi:general secretion pathway protein I